MLNYGFSAQRSANEKVSLLQGVAVLQILGRDLHAFTTLRVLSYLVTHFTITLLLHCLKTPKLLPKIHFRRNIIHPPSCSGQVVTELELAFAAERALLGTFANYHSHTQLVVSYC